VAGIFLLDLVLSWEVPYAALAAGDELAHLLTSTVAVLTLLALRGGRLTTPFVLGALVAGNVIDADHLPMAFGSDILTEGTPRPYSHSIALILLLLALAALARGGVASAVAGAAFGVAGHLVRDLATAPVALLWPASSQGLHVPYPVYAVLLLASACTAAALVRAEERQARHDVVA
jgi:inner membrane protein